MFTSIAHVFHTWQRYEAAVQELSHLSDRELTDIGINRAEISRLAWEHAHSNDQIRGGRPWPAARSASSKPFIPA